MQVLGLSFRQCLFPPTLHLVLRQYILPRPPQHRRCASDACRSLGTTSATPTSTCSVPVEAAHPNPHPPVPHASKPLPCTATQALREQCEQVLGYHFGDVYFYLREARSSGKVQDEEQVHRQLMDMLGKPSDPEVRARLMQGCFLVDQLVFQESMWSNRR